MTNKHEVKIDYRKEQKIIPKDFLLALTETAVNLINEKELCHFEIKATEILQKR